MYCRRHTTLLPIRAIQGTLHLVAYHPSSTSCRANEGGLTRAPHISPKCPHCCRWRRDGVLVGAAVVGAVACAVLAAATFLGAPLWMLYLSMALMGAYSGTNNPATESLFADSVVAGARWGVPPTTSFVQLRA